MRRQKGRMSKIPDILRDDESLEKGTPLLNSASKVNPFLVPENYFESLPSEIIEKCREKIEPKKWGKGLFNTLLGYKWTLLTATSCIAILCFFAIRLNFNIPTASYEAMSQNIPDSLIVEHLDKNITDINVSTLEDLQVPEINSTSVKKPSDSSNADQDIIAYLMNNNVSVSDIENEP